jgi:hypothetical protein
MKLLRKVLVVKGETCQCLQRLSMFLENTDTGLDGGYGTAALTWRHKQCRLFGIHRKDVGDLARLSATASRATPRLAPHAILTKFPSASSTTAIIGLIVVVFGLSCSCSILMKLMKMSSGLANMFLTINVRVSEQVEAAKKHGATSYASDWPKRIFRA